MGRVFSARPCNDPCMLTQFSDQLANVVAAVAPSVLQVRGRRRPASGIAYGPQIVLTTMGAVDSESGIEITPHEGRTRDAELIGWDPATGIALLRAPELDAPSAKPSDSVVRVGQLALAAARSWSNALTASAGIVAVIGGPLQTGRRRTIDQVFRTTAPMHDGFSGGAFLDTAGGLIGVVTAASIRGFRIIIPAATAWKAAAAILEHGQVKRGYLGVAGQSVTVPEHQRGSAGRAQGLLVMAVTTGGPAADAGVLVGDVLLAVDQQPIDSPEELMDLMHAAGAGRQVVLTVLRGTATQELTATIGQRPGR